MASFQIEPERSDPLTLEEAQRVLEKMATASQGAGPAVSPHLLARQPLQGSPGIAERRYRALIEQIPVVTFLAALDQDIREIYVSPQIEKLLGFTQAEWLDDPFLWFNQLHPDDRQRWTNEFTQTCATGTQFRSEYRFIARDGRTVWVHGECQLIRDEAGVPLFLQGIAYDITESKKAQEILQRTSQELEARVQEHTAELRQEVQHRQQLADRLVEEGRQKDQFLAVLAHELRNPLAPILPALQLLQREKAESPDTAWAVDMIGRQVHHMSKLIDDLLDVSRITRGKISLERSVVDLAVVVHRAIEEVRPLLEKCRHELVVHVPRDLAFANIDALRLEQVVANLLTNASRYSPPGGRIEVSLDRDGGDAVLSVRDNGIGIPVEMLERIFNMFTQVDTSPGRSSQSGLGVGLALVRGLVDLHGGTVTAQSGGPGKGSCFTVRLPLSFPANASPASAAGGADSRQLRRRKILLVEDNPDTASAMTRLLSLWGQDVRTAPDGSSALAQIAADPPEIVLMDIGLPGMDGYELARQIRARPDGGNIILAALTGYGQPEDQLRARECGFDLHLIKPVQIDSIRRVLEAGDRQRLRGQQP
jgi:PAS domain S-box-containing protein